MIGSRARRPDTPSSERRGRQGSDAAGPDARASIAATSRRAFGPGLAALALLLSLAGGACGPEAGAPIDGSGDPSDSATSGSEPSDGFRIDPLRPVPELRREALEATPPREDGDLREPELVEVTDLDPTIRLDIRYASADNFMGTPFYRQARAYLQRPAAEALARAHRELAEHGYGLMVYDAYRPWYVTKMFWEATPEEQKPFVADPAAGSRHNRGAAVDLTLYDLETGAPVAMPSGYDEFTDRASPSYDGGTEAERRHRDLLRRVMEAHGFVVYEHEWWHFDHEDWRRYPILNRTFEEIEEPSSAPS